MSGRKKTSHRFCFCSSSYKHRWLHKPYIKLRIIAGWCQWEHQSKDLWKIFSEQAMRTLANLSKSIFSELWKLIKDVQQSRGAFIQENGWSQKNRDLVAFSVAPFLSSPPRLCGNLESQQSQRPAKPGNLAAAARAKPELELLQGPMLWELSPLSLFAPVSQKMAIIYHHNSPRWQ